MIDLILPEDRLAFADALIQMHYDRKRVFVDRFGWKLAAPGSWLEVDQFDNDYAVYLVSRNSVGEHQASIRLLPSTHPHMLGSMFPSLCANGVPIGEDCWEISRLVTSPTATCGTSVLKAHRLLALALVEFASLNGIGRYSLVIEPGRLSALLSVGWTVRPLGLPASHEGEDLQALEIVIGPETLARMRARFQISRPVLCAKATARRVA